MDKNQIGLALGLGTLFLGYLWVNQHYVTNQESQNPTTPVLTGTNTPGIALATVTPNATLSQTSPSPAPAEITSLPPAKPEDLILDNGNLVVKFTEKGGCIESAETKLYKQHIDNSEPVSLFTSHLVCKAYGYKFANQDLRDLPAKVQRINANTISLSQAFAGVEITRKFEFSKDSYQGNLVTTVKNTTQNEIANVLSMELGATSETNAHTGFFSPNQNQFYSIAYDIDGSVKRTQLPFEKEPSAKVLDTETGIRPLWVASGSMYFLSALMPKDNLPVNLSVARLGKLLQQGVNTPPDQTVYEAWMDTPVKIPAGSEQNFSYSLYIGPKLKSELDKFSDKDLTKAVDYGFFRIVAWPLFYALEFICKIVRNWGLAIIILTAIVKIFLYPLALKSYLAGKKMQKIQPEIKAIQEKYKDDKQKANQEVMAMMSQKGANPLSGCLPILPQLPIFFGLYSVFQQTFELRQAPFFFWIKDLSVMDPYFVLPALIAVLYFVQQKLTPMAAGMDPMQQKMMQFMPFIFSIMMITFPSGLALYIVTNTVLSILQQWYMIKRYKNI